MEIFNSKRFLVLVFLFCAYMSGAAAGNIRIEKVEPTIFYPKVKKNEPLKQIARIFLNNSGKDALAYVKISIEGKSPCREELGIVQSGLTTKEIGIAEVSRPTKVIFELYEQGKTGPAAVREMIWQPQRKWKIYCVSYSHQDLGYANYHHRVRRNVRDRGIELALEYCSATDDWDDNSKFHWTIETSEPVIPFVGKHSDAEVDELIRRIKEGRIEIGGLHSTVCTELMSYEMMARLMYTSNRYLPDLLAVKARKTGQNDDVVGLSWPLALYTKEAGLRYFFHGPNHHANCLVQASREPVFYWQAPDGDTKNKTLFRTIPYMTDPIDDGGEQTIEKLIAKYAGQKNWVYDSILSQNTRDFSVPTMDWARKIRKWNAKWCYPRLICGTMTMFFDDIASQADKAPIATFAKDATNPWADQDATDAGMLGLVRKLDYEIPTAERFSTIATTLGGGGYPWRDIWQGYNRILTYHEHTLGSSKWNTNARRVETERVEHRALAWEAQEFCGRALTGALAKLADAIETKNDAIVIVFNPLNWERTDIVRFKSERISGSYRLVDNTTGQVIPYQELADGTVIFEAEAVPSMGYKTFGIISWSAPDNRLSTVQSTDTTLENRYYKISFDRKTGGILSIFDKELGVELVDRNAPYKFNEYLYQRAKGSTYEQGLQWHCAEGLSLSAAVGPVAGIMTSRVRALGCRSIEQDVIVYNNIKRIDFIQRLDKSPSGCTLDDYKATNFNGREAVYYALPFKVDNFEIRHELAGAVIEPITDQFEGACTAFHAIGHFSDISNNRYGVTVATIEAPLIEYGRPRPALWLDVWHRNSMNYESELIRPSNSHIYFYLMNNFFQTNIHVDQQGLKTFTWSLRSHKKDWRCGRAYRFGWDVSHPLIAKVSLGKRSGVLEPGSCSFVSVDKPNVVCTTIKPAEANGSGVILRFNELSGIETTATVTLWFFGEVGSANETNLVEDDRSVKLKVSDKNKVTFTIRPYGVKTIRVQSQDKGKAAKVKGLKARAVADMQVELSWKAIADKNRAISHYNIYRGRSVEFKPSLRNLVGRCAATSYTDRPRLDYGGWINNRIEPDTVYYYKITAVDRWNNESEASKAVKVKTLKASEKNSIPSRVKGLYVAFVSDITEDRYLNLIFYTNVESDVTGYRIHRSSEPNFVPEASNLLGFVDMARTVTEKTAAREKLTRRLGDYCSAMYADKSVGVGQRYYYKVCAVDRAGNIGRFSRETSGQVKP